MWRVPPNWSPRDWSKELSAEVIAAACEAEHDFDPTRGVPLAAFVRQRVLARALRRYRQEWSYARHCCLHLEGDGGIDATDGRFSSSEDLEQLRRSLDRLPERHRRLIDSLYWDEKTQVEAARVLSLSQQAISRRKRLILEQLRCWMGLTEKKYSSKKTGSKSTTSLHS
jgi:RNA polymerase sigma-70 factor (ECF subfamily)